MRHDGPEQTKVWEREDFSESGLFRVTPDDTGIRVPGPGSLDTLLVAADSKDFGVCVETEMATVVEHDYERLAEYSDELDHLSAYQTGGGSYVIGVSNVEYGEYVRAEVTPRGEVAFDWVRAVYTLGQA